MAITITRTAWIDDDGSGTTGTVINNAVKTELYNQIDQGFAQFLDTGQGVPIDIPFDAANFFAGGGLIWTVAAGDVLGNSYAKIGRQITWAVSIAGGSLTGTAGQPLILRTTTGGTIARHVRGPGILTVGGTNVPMVWIAAAGVTNIELYPTVGSSIPTGSPVWLFLNMTFWS